MAHLFLPSGLCLEDVMKKTVQDIFSREKNDISVLAAMEHDELIAVGVKSFGVRHKLIRGVANLPTQQPLTSMETGPGGRNLGSITDQPLKSMEKGPARKNQSSLNPSFVALKNKESVR